MAVVSDAMYNVRTAAASYVSSSAYYGYVPPCVPSSYAREDSGRIIGLNGDGDYSMRSQCVFDSAMETDDDGFDCSTAAARRLNNHCVIPEATTWNRRAETTADRQRCYSQQQQRPTVCQEAADKDATHRRNRKRCCADHGPARQSKKFREGGGNGRVYYGTASSKDRGLAKMHYEPASLHLNTTRSKAAEQPPIAIDSCCWAAGNCSLISNRDCKHLLSRNSFKTIESGAEYEKMLFETHGCTVYHHHRQQQSETDFEF